MLTLRCTSSPGDWQKCAWSEDRGSLAAATADTAMSADDKLMFITIRWGSKALCTIKLFMMRGSDSFYDILFKFLPDGRNLVS